MAAKATAWFDEALAATDRAQFDALIKQVTIKPLTEREARKVRPMFTVQKQGDEPEIDNDRMIESFMGACIVDAKGKRAIPEGREEEIADLPAYMFQALAVPVLAANGYGGSEGNS